MTLFIQRAGHRDTQAIQAKLDEPLREIARARTELTELDQLEPEESNNTVPTSGDRPIMNIEEASGRGANRGFYALANPSL
jgi:low affinity Fe/Cu permease